MRTTRFPRTLLPRTLLPRTVRSSLICFAGVGAILLTLIGCSGLGGSSGPPGLVKSDRDLSPPLTRVIRIFDGKSGKEVEWESLLDRLAKNDVVFLGETHLDAVTHRTEHAIFEGLLDRRSGDVTLAMEMFTRADQPAIDRYLAGEIDEATFGEEARLWPNYRTGYRALVELAKRRKAPVIGSNLSRAARAIGRGGLEAHAEWIAAGKGGVAKELFANDPLYWQRFDRTVRGHGMAFGGQTDEQRLTSVQSLWDNTMGESCAIAYFENPERLVLHVNGGFHTRGGLGTADQFAKRAPDATWTTVQIVPVNDLAGIQFEPKEGSDDWIVFAEARARGLSSGTHAVTVRKEWPYHLHVPEGEGPWPLLVWFPNEGAIAKDDLTRLRLLYGDESAIAVLEHPYPTVEPQLHRSGRYTWDDSFFEDLGMVGAGLPRIVDAIERYYPIDAERRVVAGRGVGGVLAAASRWQDREGLRTLVIDPGPVGRLGEGGLPDSEEPKGGLLTVIAAEDDLAVWQKEAGDRESAGYPSEVIAEEGIDSTNLIGEQLGLPPRKDSSAGGILWISEGSPLGRQWAELLAAGLGGEWRVESEFSLTDSPQFQGERAGFLCDPDVGIHANPFKIPVRFQPEDFLEGKGLPMPPGAFGGTVVLVLPAETTDDLQERWSRLEEEDVLRQRSRFVGLRVAKTGGERDLPAVIQELKDEGKSVLRIVPVKFAASAAAMRSLAESIEGLTDGMRVAWSPGLGGTIWQTLAEESEKE